MIHPNDWCKRLGHNNVENIIYKSGNSGADTRKNDGIV